MTPNAPGIQLEIAVQDAEGARMAAEGGADRLELCQALVLGGLTPSRGLMEQAGATGVPFHPLIRLRAGGFEYTRAEVAVMVRDIETAVQCGAAGVVIGALQGAALDQTTLRTLAGAAEGKAVIIHRCVDVLLSNGLAPAQVADQVLTAGGTGVLTSGGALRAIDGLGTITALAAAGGQDLQVIAGGAVQPEDVLALAATGAHAVHLSARRQITAGPSGPGGGAEDFMATDPAGVQAARSAVDALG